MSEIQTFPFNKDDFNQIKGYKFGKNWPVVYVLENKSEVYIGQTINAHYRSKQHYENPERRKLNQIHIISDEEFNVSATLDIESWLIQYIAADGRYMLQNGNGGLKNHNYYDKEKYRTKFEIAWGKLRSQGIVQNKLEDLRNSDLFKYSPYKSLTEDQYFVAKQIFKDIKQNEFNTFIVNGKPGTGKTILATYLFKYLKEQKETKDLTIGLVVPMSSLRKTIGKVFSKIKGFKANMVIGPNDVIKQKYDLLIVDEAHRLQRRKNIMGYGAFDIVSKKLGFGDEGTQLDWIMASSKHQIFFYDENQSVKPSDIRPKDFAALNSRTYRLKSQMRIGAGEDFVNFIDDIFDLKIPKQTSFPNYDFQIFENIEEMVSEIKLKNKKYSLARMVSGYAWPWNTKPSSKSELNYDIEIEGKQYVWNSTATDWVNSPNAINEVGCIHTVQGYDLNYVGVIIGPEFSYSSEEKKFKVDKNKYFDTNGRNGIVDPEELERYIKNIYKTLLTRGINGTYLYIVDPELRKYFKSLFVTTKLELTQTLNKEDVETLPIVSPYARDVTSVPLFDSIGCGELMLADSVSDETVDVPAWLIKPGAKYFALRTRGDSMNELGINDGDIILCQKNFQASSGSNAVVLIGDDATLKQIKYEKDGLVLIPRSTNSVHKVRKLTEEDEEFKVLGVFVAKL